MTKRLVILGATGDLTGRYLLPALAQLEASGHAPSLEILGASREAWDTDRFRTHARDRLERHATDIPHAARRRIVERLDYERVDVTDPESLAAVVHADADEVIVYLALPPALFASTIEGLAHVECPGGLRMVLEKPFGTDLASARELNRLLHDGFEESAIFRMDHFLGKQTVQNLLGIRFANRVFAPLWGNKHIERVDIVWDETIALEGRAGYYDRTGAVRDMIQNHLLQVLALVAMERPMSLRAERFRDAKVQLFREIQSPTPATIAGSAIRARYTRGQSEGREVPDYVDEVGVEPARDTETFAEITLQVDNERWEGVPFRMRTGKALASARREIHVHFHAAEPLPFAPEADVMPNRLLLSMDPDRLELDIALNGSGDPFRLEPRRLDLELAPQELSAYARLLLDALEGDPSLSIRGDEAEESWRVVEPIIAAWESGAVPLSSYPAGSSGPPQSSIPSSDTTS